MEYIRLSSIDIVKQKKNRVAISFLAKSIDVRPQKNNRNCMRIIMKDKDVEVEAMKFDITTDDVNNIVEGKAYNALIDVKEYDKGKDGISCIVAAIERSELNEQVFSDWVDKELLERACETIKNCLGMIGNSVCGVMANNIIVENWNKFACWPAATGFHHTSLGGLLLHTATVAESCLLISEVYSRIYGDKFINKNLLLSAAILHDIGKIDELDVSSGSVKYSTESALTTHVVDVVLKVEKEAIKLGVSGNMEVKELQHLLLAHHGKLEWGSPIVPNMFEAKILNEADTLDADSWRFHKNIKKLEAGESKVEWSSSGMQVYYRSIVNENNKEA